MPGLYGGPGIDVADECQALTCGSRVNHQMLIGKTATATRATVFDSMSFEPKLPG